MPMVILAGCAAAMPRAPARPSAHAARTTRVLVAIDSLLRVDPALQVADLNAARLGAVPRVVRLARPAELVVEDAEVDERLGRIAGEVLHRAEIVAAERQ